VPYDEHLLERSRTQWQFGDWASLAALSQDTLQHHPDRAKLALLAAAGHAQLGQTEPARQYTRLAQDWGCPKKLVAQVLISGTHNSLARAAAVSGRPEQARSHFEHAVRIGMPHADASLLTPARAQKQLADMGLLQAPASWVGPGNDTFNGLHSALPMSNQTQARTHLNSAASLFRPRVLTQHNLGLAWSGNTINTVIFRHHGILTHQGLQTTAFYVNETTLRLVQRNLASNTLQTHDLPGNYNLRDAHNSISLGVDRAGHLHISYDHHATQLRYRRSTQPNNISAWSEELPMTGQHEERVTYPCFIVPRHRYPLTLLYRDGSSENGTARLKTYDEASQTWADHPQAILTGTGQKPWTSNAYWNHPAVGTDGTLHLSFVWRTHSLGQEQRVNNVNICYACSADNGLSWRTSLGRPCQLPITPVNAETIHAVSPGSNLINQCSMALDSQNRPHIVFYANDADGTPQYQHLRFDGKRWHHQDISARTQPFDLAGGGTLQIPISRPDLVIDAQDNAYVIYRGDLRQNRLAATLLPAPDYRWQANSARTLWPEPLDYAEPIIDRSRWAQDNTLTLLLQANDQHNHDTQHQTQQSTVTLVDLQLK